MGCYLGQHEGAAVSLRSLKTTWPNKMDAKTAKWMPRVAELDSQHRERELHLNKEFENKTSVGRGKGDSGERITHI